MMPVKALFNKATLKDVVNLVEKNHDIFSLTDQFRNLSLNEKKKGASSSGASLNNTKLLSSTESLLERFMIRTNSSPLTRNIIKLTKAPFIDIHKPLLSKPLLNLTKNSSSYMMSFGFRFMPGQGEFLIKDLRIPDTLAGLRKFRDSLGLSLTKGTLRSTPLVKLKGLSDSVRNNLPALASRILVEAITFHEGYYGRFLILIHMGIGCTVWYGFAPGDGINIPTEGLAPLFSLVQ